MLFLWQAVQGLLKLSFSFPDVAFFRDVLPQGDGFGSCEACKSVIVHAGGAQPAQLIAVDKGEAETTRPPERRVGTRQGAASWQSSWGSLFLSRQNYLKLLDIS